MIGHFIFGAQSGKAGISLPTSNNLTIISLSLILSKKEVVLDWARRTIFRNTLFSKWEANFNDVRAISTSVSKSDSKSWCVLVETDTETDFELLCFHSEELIHLLAEALGEETCVTPRKLGHDSAHNNPSEGANENANFS